MKWSKKDVVIAGLLSLILLAIAGGIAYISYKFKDYEFALSHIAETKQVPGPKGADGLTTTQTIVSYLPGKDGKDASDEQVAAAVNNYMASHPIQRGEAGEKGNKGDQGEPGSPGKSVFIRLSGDAWECLFSGDTVWQPISECSQ